MPCYHPLPGWKARTVGESGTRGVVLTPRSGFTDLPVELPCGQCIGCRLERARMWSLRLMHEASLWESSVFVTLTYDDAHVPADGSLRPRDFTLFMKRLRRGREEKDGPVRYYQAGEYGEELGRPHHHAVLFNVALDDGRVCGRSGEKPLWHSDKLDALWGQGRCTYGDVTQESAGYVARYCLKKVTGLLADSYYSGRVPEYSTMSRRPGIGQGWFEKWRMDIHSGMIRLRGGQEVRAPRYYEERCTEEEQFRWKVHRKVKAQDSPDSTGKRLVVREAVKQSQVQFLQRPLHGQKGK